MTGKKNWDYLYLWEYSYNILWTFKQSPSPNMYEKTLLTISEPLRVEMLKKKTRKTKKKDECIFVVNTNTRRVHGCMAWSGCLVWKYALIHWKNRPCPHGLRLKELDQDYIYIRRRSWISDQIPWHSLKGIIIFLESAT
jgi:hypothetical protein